MLTLIGVCALLSSCLPAEDRDQGSTSIEVRPEQQQGNVRESPSPPLLTTATAVLRQLPGEELGSGFAEAKVFTDGLMRINIRTNLDPLKRGTYRAWLRGGVLPEPLNIGALQNPKGDTTYLLQGEEHIQLPRPGSTEQVWTLTISRESHDSPQGESTPVLEGTLTVASPL